MRQCWICVVVLVNPLASTIRPLCRGDNLYFRFSHSFTESNSTSSLPASLIGTPESNERKKVAKSRASSWNLRELIQKSHKLKRRTISNDPRRTIEQQRDGDRTATPTLRQSSHSSTGTILSDADMGSTGNAKQPNMDIFEILHYVMCFSLIIVTYIP